MSETTPDAKPMDSSIDEIEKYIVLSKVYDYVSLEPADEEEELHDIDDKLIRATRSHLHKYLKQTLSTILSEKKEDNSEENKKNVKAITSLAKYFGNTSRPNDKELVKHLEQYINTYTIKYFTEWLKMIDDMCEKHKFEY